MASDGCIDDKRMQIFKLKVFLFLGSAETAIRRKEKRLGTSGIHFATTTSGSSAPRPIRCFFAFASRAHVGFARALHAQARTFDAVLLKDGCIDDVFPGILLRTDSISKRRNEVCENHFANCHGLLTRDKNIGPVQVHARLVDIDASRRGFNGVLLDVRAADDHPKIF